MSSLKITVDASAIEMFHHRFSKLQADFPGALKKATQEATTALKDSIPPYPPIPPGSRYKRTGRLGKSFKVSVDAIGTQVVGHIQSRGVVYAPYVIDEKRQAWMHKGRWWTLQEVLSGNTSKLLAYYNGLFERVWKKIYTGHRDYL